MRSDTMLPALTRAPVLALGVSLVLACALRLVAFPFNEHLYGDAIARTELAEQWARAPHVITSFGDGAMQFGPLHLYLVGAALTAIDRDDAGRVVSLLFGVLTVVPVFALTRHYFGSTSALVAALALGAWGLHIQASTTGGSEALALFLMWVAFAWFGRAVYRPHWVPVAISAAAMNLAAATRYDAWMYIPLMAALPAWVMRDRQAGRRLGLLFLLCCLPFPAVWMAGNAVAHGDALYPLTYINEYHRQWAAEAGSTPWREAWLRMQGLGFWPAMALFTLTPGVALLGLIGMVATWKTRPLARWLTVAAAAPTLYYGARTTLLADFVPLGRFTIVQVSLLLPFVGPGLGWIAGERGPLVTRRVAWASVALALAMPLALGAFTWRSDSTAAIVLAPLSPVATNPTALMSVAAFVNAQAAVDGRAVGLDADHRYRDLTVGFYARLDPARTLRVRWPGHTAQIAQTPPDLLVVFDNGTLADEPWVHDDEDRLRVHATTYRLLRREGPVRVFERAGAPDVSSSRPSVR